ncbi:hypothetical protein JMM59_18995 [Rhodovulum sulfidophilum]|nr:hypothetical protein [Rhodovulum sulfidophilum]MBL3567083.1 hypothetical protein [Rhodovulum sulfidophilum]
MPEHAGFREKGDQIDLPLINLQPLSGTQDVEALSDDCKMPVGRLQPLALAHDVIGLETVDLPEDGTVGRHFQSRQAAVYPKGIGQPKRPLCLPNDTFLGRPFEAGITICALPQQCRALWAEFHLCTTGQVPLIDKRQNGTPCILILSHPPQQGRRARRVDFVARAFIAAILAFLGNPFRLRDMLRYLRGDLENPSVDIPPIPANFSARLSIQKEIAPCLAEEDLLTLLTWQLGDDLLSKLGSLSRRLLAVVAVLYNDMTRPQAIVDLIVGQLIKSNISINFARDGNPQRPLVDDQAGYAAMADLRVWLQTNDLVHFEPPSTSISRSMMPSSRGRSTPA